MSLDLEPLPAPPHEDSDTMGTFLSRHSQADEYGTSLWTYRFTAPGNHDVHVLVISGEDAPALMQAAAQAAGLPGAQSVDTLH